MFSFEDGLKLVAARGRYMQEAAVATPSGMVAIMGADEAAVNKLCAGSGAKAKCSSRRTSTPRGRSSSAGRQAACERVAEAGRGGGLQGGRR